MAELTDEVTRDGQTLHAPLLACRPVRPLDYPPARLLIWNTVSAQVGYEIRAYTGSAEGACEACGIAVLIGPRQQEARGVAADLGLRSHVLCSLCAVERAAAEVGQFVNLGNPEGEPA